MISRVRRFPRTPIDRTVPKLKPGQMRATLLYDNGASTGISVTG